MHNFRYHLHLGDVTTDKADIAALFATMSMPRMA